MDKGGAIIMFNVSFVVKKPTKKSYYIDLHQKKKVVINKKFRKKYYWGRVFWFPADIEIEDKSLEDFGHFMIIICDKSKVATFKKMPMDSYVISYEEFEKWGLSLEDLYKKLEDEDRAIRKIIMNGWNKKETVIEYLPEWSRIIDCSGAFRNTKIVVSSKRKEIPGLMLCFEEFTIFEKENIMKKIEFKGNIERIEELSFQNVHITELILSKNIEDIEIIRLYEGASIDRIICSQKIGESLKTVLPADTRFTFI